MSRASKETFPFTAWPEPNVTGRWKPNWKVLRVMVESAVPEVPLASCSVMPVAAGAGSAPRVKPEGTAEPLALLVVWFHDAWLVLVASVTATKPNVSCSVGRPLPARVNASSVTTTLLRTQTVTGLLAASSCVKIAVL
jgi:hypothetical protein